MANNWLDNLAALKASMGPDDSTPQPEAEANVPARSVQSARLDIVFETKGRAGKSATIVCGFTLPDDEVAAIAADLKRALGCGGSARGGEILLQGDRRQKVLELLLKKGFKARVI